MKAGTKEYYSQYYQNNKVKHYDNIKRFRKENPELAKKYVKDWRNKNSESLKQTWREQKVQNNRNKRNLILEIKKKGFCSKCNDSRWFVLDFHHVDPSQKLFDLGEGTKFGKNKILNEIKKCVLLCANCHREFHFLEKEKQTSLIEYLK
jgi:hypothetical protein